MGHQMRGLIISNQDPTSSMLFRKVCESSGLEIVGVGFTCTLTKSESYWRGLIDIFRVSGLPYFFYVSFWNSVFLIKENLVFHLRFLRRVFRGFFSLKIWAHEHRIPIVYSSNFNSSEFLHFVKQQQPDVILVRANQILRQSLLEVAPRGCWCFHSSELPKYQGIAAEFHGMRNGEKTVGFTVMKMEPRLDAGPIIAQGAMDIPPGVTLYTLVRLNNRLGQEIIGQALDKLISGELSLSPQNSKLRSYYSWPSPEATRTFRQKGFKYISAREAIAYLVE